MEPTLQAAAKDASAALGRTGALMLAVIAIIRTLRPEAARFAGALLQQGHEALIASSLATPSQTDALIDAQRDVVQILLETFQEQAARD